MLSKHNLMLLHQRVQYLKFLREYSYEDRESNCGSCVMLAPRMFMFIVRPLSSLKVKVKGISGSWKEQDVESTNRPVGQRSGGAESRSDRTQGGRSFSRAARHRRLAPSSMWGPRKEPTCQRTKY